MTDLFLSVLNMSLTASYVVAAVIILRIFLKKLPKIFSYILWLPVLLRLILPFSISSPFSFFGFLRASNLGTKWTITTMTQNGSRFISDGKAPVGESWINGVDKAGSSIPSSVQTFPNMEANYSQNDFFLKISSVIWLTGITVLIVYSIVSYLKVAKRISTATLIRDNIFESDKISSPFVFGFFKPKIIIPVGLTDSDRSIILAHEQTHIKRRDYLIKPFFYLALTLHWFNPLVWVSFILMSRDMEMSCDESVIRGMGNSIKANYSNSLLSFSVQGGRFITGSPLAFGESALKARIKNILNYRKPSFWITAIIIILVAVFITVFATNPEKEIEKELAFNGYNIEKLLKNKTPYVGDNSKVAAIIDALKLPEGLIRNTIELKTEESPYGLIINLDMEDASGMLQNGAISSNALFTDSVLLFSLIDNVDYIEFRIEDKTGKYDGAKYGFTFTRAEVERLTGEDVRVYSANEASIQKLIDKVLNMNVNIAKDNYKVQLSELNEESEKTNYDDIEKRLDILTQADTSSNPEDYIETHSIEYEEILKMGDKALEYFLDQFKENKVDNDLRGYIIMSLCKELLGSWSNIPEGNLTPAQWYSRITQIKEVPLGDFKARCSDPIEQAVYDAVSAHYSDPAKGFNVVAPTILGTYEEKDKLKAFVTVYISYYKLYDKTVISEGGGIFPIAITFNRDTKGGYITEKIEKAKDGAYFAPSIKEFCKLPVSNKPIKDLDKMILKDYKDHSSRMKLGIKNLTQHLEDNKLSGISLRGVDGKLLKLN